MVLSLSLYVFFYLFWASCHWDSQLKNLPHDSYLLPPPSQRHQLETVSLKKNSQKIIPKTAADGEKEQESSKGTNAPTLTSSTVMRKEEHASRGGEITRQMDNLLKKIDGHILDSLVRSNEIEGQVDNSPGDKVDGGKRMEI